MTTGEVFVPTLIQIRAWLPPLFLYLAGLMFWDRGRFRCNGEGGVLAGPNFDMG